MSAPAGPATGQIVFAVPDFEPLVGGTTRHVGLLARGLAERGHDVLVVTRRTSRRLPRRQVVGGLEVRRIGLPGRTRAGERLALLALALWLALRRRRIGVVAAVMWPDSGLAVAAAGLLGRTAVVWAIRGEIDRALRLGGTPLRRQLVSVRRSLLRRTTHVVLTQAMAAELEEQALGVRPRVVPVPVNLGEFRPPRPEERERERARFELPEDAFTVAYVGHLERRKAVDSLIDAVAALAREGRSVRLLIVGAGRGVPDDTEAALRAQVTSEGLDGLVRFCGSDPDPRPYLWAADAFVLPSLREGMPNSLLEAMACGVPCVAPPSAGGDELLGDGAGLVPPTNSAADIALALRKVADEPELRRSVRKAGKARVARFSVENVVERFEALCAELFTRR